MIEVPVIQAFTHEGRAIAAGDTISVSPIEAAVLHRQGLVSLTRGFVPTAPSGSFSNFGKGTSATLHGCEQVISADEADGIAGMVRAAIARPPVDPVDPDEGAPPTRRTRTRDLSPESDDTPTTPRRRYRRRDLTPES